MLDPKFFRTDIDNVAARLMTRGFNLDVSAYNQLEEKRKALQVKTQELQNERNVRSKSIGQAKAKGEDIQPLLAQVSQLGNDLDEAKSDLETVVSALNVFYQETPNLPDEDVPTGKDEEENVEIAKWGEPRSFDFEVKDHVDIGAGLGNGLDFETAAKLSGARFAVLRGDSSMTSLGE